MAAYRELEALPKDMAHYKQKLALDYAEIVYNESGSPRCGNLSRCLLRKGQRIHYGRGDLTPTLQRQHPAVSKSPEQLYSLDIASFTMGAEYDQRDARGFINLIGLPIQVRASLKKSAKKTV